MSDSLRATIADHAARFTDEIMALVWNGLSERLAANDRNPRHLGQSGRAPRRSVADLEAMSDRIVAVLGKSAAGMRAEVLRAKLAASRSQLGRPMEMLLALGRVTKTGHKRATIYHLGVAAAEPAGGERVGAMAGGTKTGPRRSTSAAGRTARKRRARAGK
jgi:hypothetical protein